MEGAARCSFLLLHTVATICLIVPFAIFCRATASGEFCTADGVCRNSVESKIEAMKELPAAGERGSEGQTTSLADQMGPLVINEDGSMKRITNWQEMTETERANTLRVVTKRNAKRIEKLKQLRQELVGALSEAAIIPDVLQDVADATILFTQVNYAATDPRQPWIEVKIGMELTPALTREEPSVVWPTPAAGSADPEASFMTVIMVDPDAPSREAPRFRHWLHWLVVDIENSGEDQRSIGRQQTRAERDGIEVASYNGPTPPKGTGLHRYVFLLYRHSARIAGAVDRSVEGSRGGFDLAGFTERHALGAPVGVVFFTCRNG